MKRIRATGLALLATLATVACSTELATEPPLVIDDELLADTFEECELDITACLEDQLVLEEIHGLVESGEWAWPQADDGTVQADDGAVQADDGAVQADDGAVPALATYYFWVNSGCIPPAYRYTVLRSRCYALGGTLVSQAILARYCSSRLRLYRGLCRSR